MGQQYQWKNEAQSDKTKMELVKLHQHQDKIKENNIQPKLTTTEFQHNLSSTKC